MLSDIPDFRNSLVLSMKVPVCGRGVVCIGSTAVFLSEIIYVGSGCLLNLLSYVIKAL